jgi:hypothetical protein
MHFLHAIRLFILLKPVVLSKIVSPSLPGAVLLRALRRRPTRPRLFRGRPLTPPSIWHKHLNYLELFFVSPIRSYNWSYFRTALEKSA